MPWTFPFDQELLHYAQQGQATSKFTLINRRTLKYPLDIAETDYYLAVAAKLISESALGSQLVFKGGTALHHCYLLQHRFSEDLDYTSLMARLELASVVAILQSTGEFQLSRYCHQSGK